MKIAQTPVGHRPPATFSPPVRQSHETLWDGTKIPVRGLEPEDFPAVMALAEELLAVGNYTASGEFSTAEISVVIARRNHHRGIATALLRRLGERARRAGVELTDTSSTGPTEAQPTALLCAVR